jgi:hypothetical protein
MTDSKAAGWLVLLQGAVTFNFWLGIWMNLSWWHHDKCNGHQIYDGTSSINQKTEAAGSSVSVINTAAA